MGRRMALRVVLPPVCISSPAAAQEASAWMGELSRTGALQPADDVYVADSADGWIKGDVGGLSGGNLEARANGLARGSRTRLASLPNVRKMRRHLTRRPAVHCGPQGVAPALPRRLRSGRG